MKKLYKRLKPLLGTFVEVAVSTEHEDPTEFVTDAFKKIEFLQSLLSFHNPLSEISKINFSAGKIVSTHPETFELLQLAKKLELDSNGKFNCTVGGKLVRLGRLPDLGFPHFLDSGNESDIELFDSSKKTVQLKRPVLITLDGIAKGYAVDCAVKVLKDHGLTSGWINAGGDLRIFGDVELPVTRREENKAMRPLGTFSNVSIATSKISAVSVPEYPGSIVASALNQPQPGIWTISAPEAWLADALTKVAAQLGDRERSHVITQLGGQLIT